MNNEPLELARKQLSGPDGRNQRRAGHADRAVLLIDPFPSRPAFDPDYRPAPDLLSTATSLFGALKNQARFKPDELMLAAQEDVYSRFMIAPNRSGAAYPIACGLLGGFGGFLKRDFRAHDYFLGRRNAQKFLQAHFVLPESNPLFLGWSEEQKEAHCVRASSGEAKMRHGRRFLPIIPLVGQAGHPCYKPEWPRYTPDDLTQLLRRLDSRVNKVLDRLVDQYFESNNPVVRLIAKIVIGRKKKDIVEIAEKKLGRELEKMGLMG